MDIKKEQYHNLTEKLQAALPLKAYPVREMVQMFRDKGMTLKTELVITAIINSGDISGI